MPPLQWEVGNKGISRLSRYVQLGNGKSNGRLTLRLRPFSALQRRDQGALRVNPERTPTFKSEKAEGLTIREWDQIR